MARSTNPELVRRINGTLALLKKFPSIADAARTVARKYGVSKMQAYRYIRQAQQVKRTRPIPERKVVFTVKLPMGLVRRFRKLAKSSGESLSRLVTRALEFFLRQKQHG